MFAKRNVFQVSDGIIHKMDQQIIAHSTTKEMVDKLSNVDFDKIKEDESNVTQTHVRIIGNDAFVVRETIERSSSVREFADKIAEQALARTQNSGTAIKTPFMTSELKTLTYVQKEDGTSVWITQADPAVRPVLFGGTAAVSSDHDYQALVTQRDWSYARYNIALPYVINVWVFGSARGDALPPLQYLGAFGSGSPLKSLTDPVYRLGLPNIGGDGICCIGDMDTRPRGDETQGARVDRMFGLWMSAEFNDDLFDLPNTVLGWRHWEYLTTQDPEFILAATGGNAQRRYREGLNGALRRVGVTL